MTHGIVVNQDGEKASKDKRINPTASQKGNAEQCLAVAAGHNEFVINGVRQKGNNKQNQYDVRNRHSSSRIKNRGQAPGG
ncbi:hypothetical protein D3C85_1808750 [compost metagenome]